MRMTAPTLRWSRRDRTLADRPIVDPCQRLLSFLITTVIFSHLEEYLRMEFNARLEPYDSVYPWEFPQAGSRVQCGGIKFVGSFIFLNQGVGAITRASRL